MKRGSTSVSESLSIKDGQWHNKTGIYADGIRQAYMQMAYF